MDSLMFAVIETGGKQYKVTKDATLSVEKLEGNPGDKVSLSVLLVGNGDKVSMGAGKVTAEIVEQGLGDKVLIFKKKRRQNYRRTRGHRQPFTAVKVVEITEK